MFFHVLWYQGPHQSWHDLPPFVQYWLSLTKIAAINTSEFFLSAIFWYISSDFENVFFHNGVECSTQTERFIIGFNNEILIQSFILECSAFVAITHKNNKFHQNTLTCGRWSVSVCIITDNFTIHNYCHLEVSKIHKNCLVLVFDTSLLLNEWAIIIQWYCILNLQMILERSNPDRKRTYPASMLKKP